MKLSGRAAQDFFRKPDPGVPAVLVYGGDQMRVADKRQTMVAAMIGPEGEAEMRLQRIAASDLRSDPALLDEALRAQGFFPGPRVALVEDATDGLSDTVARALEDWREGDARIVVTAGALAAKSALRKLFEGHGTALSIALYDDPPGPEEVSERLEAAGLTRVSPEAREGITALARTLEPGDFRQTLEKLSLYKAGDPEPVSAEDLAACAPLSTEAALDELIAAAAEGEAAKIGPLMRRLTAQGIAPVRVCIMATRHFRQLHAAASDSGGAASGVGKLRPPVWGPRRDRMIRQAGTWGRDRLEAALSLLIDTDLQLRSADRAPEEALVERHLIRLAMMGRQRR